MSSPSSTPFRVFHPKHNYIKSVRDNKPQEPKQHIQSCKHLPQQILAQKEQRVLKISMMCAFVLAMLGVGFGVWIQSSAVVFDGFVSFVSVGLGLLSVITSRYIYKEDDDVFQYGYVRFEPMVNLFKALILVFVCVYAFINAVSSLFSGGYEVKLDGAVLYSVCAFVFCAALFAYTSIYAKTLESDLIRVDNTEWKIDCVLYLGALMTFGILYVLLGYMQGSGACVDSSECEILGIFPALAYYIDPLLLAILSLLLCVSPVRICIANFKDLIMVAPSEIDEKITQIMEDLSKEYGFRDYDTHTAKSGRFYMIEVNILLNAHKDTSAQENACSYSFTSIQDFDSIRERIEKALEIPSYKIWLSVSFTANPKWL
ncbi:cation diffusion facilitator family transporter [uncultured Helicobacter sp.]|uniref:cation diffusion facilitator family transporter n=1 Tax=uncultured Helicobacter sp. TaxID=175537 RepID=UPI00374F0516